MSNFSRKYDYKDEFYNELFEIHKKYKDILFVANESYVKGYYNGLVLFSRFGVNTINFVDNEKLKSILTDYNNIGNAGKRTEKVKWILGNTESIQNMMKDWMPRDKERKSSQRIALKNMTFDNDKFSVCGWETTIPNSVIGDKKPEIDIVIVKPETHEMFFIEYKCNSSAVYGQAGFEKHLKDYVSILCCKDIESIKYELLKAFCVMRKIYKKSNCTDDDLILQDSNKYKVRIGFLFVNEVKNGRLEPNDYKNCGVMYNQFLENLKTQKEKDIANEIVYWRLPSDKFVFDDVQPKPICELLNEK